MKISFEDFAKEIFKSLIQNGFSDPIEIADFSKLGIEMTVQHGQPITMTYYRSTTLLNKSEVNKNNH